MLLEWMGGRLRAPSLRQEIMSQPQKVGQYNFLKKLGAGRMAEVYLGRIEGAEGFQKPVAIKKILPDLASDGQFVQSLIAEAKVGGQLHHRNIVEVYDFIRYGTDYCIIMEYVDGVDLGRILRSARRYRVRIPPAAALYIASQVCDGLDYAHSARGFNGEPLNIVHRDLKPSNVLISIKGGVKISDFGIARVMDQVVMRSNGTSKLSLQYQSPEGAAGEGRLAPSSDVFSIGLILFEMLTLEPFFPGRSANELLEVLREPEFSKRLTLAQRQLPGSERVLAAALHPNPAERYRTASVMAEDLRKLLAYMKVDDPKERLASFFNRLIRFVQDQGRRPQDGQPVEAAEDWEQDGRAEFDVSRTSSDRAIPEGTGTWQESGAAPVVSAPSAGYAPPSPPMAPSPGVEDPNAWSGRPEMTIPQPMQPPQPQAYGGAESAQPGYGWPQQQQTVADPYATINPGQYQAAPEAYAGTPARAEETQVGGYATVQQNYNETANIAMPPPLAPGYEPPASGADSTRIIPAETSGYPPPIPGGMPQPYPQDYATQNQPGWGADPATHMMGGQAAQGYDATSNVSMEDDVAPPPKKKTALYVGAFLVLLVLVGGGAALIKNQMQEATVVEPGGDQQLTASTPAASPAPVVASAAPELAATPAPVAPTPAPVAVTPVPEVPTPRPVVATPVPKTEVPVVRPTVTAPAKTPRPEPVTSSYSSTSGSSSSAGTSTKTNPEKSPTTVASKPTTSGSSTTSYSDPYVGESTTTATKPSTTTTSNSKPVTTSSPTSATTASGTGTGTAAGTGTGTGKASTTTTTTSPSTTTTVASVPATDPKKAANVAELLKDIDKMASKAEQGKLSTTELGALDSVARNSDDFTRSRVLLAAHYRKSGNSDSYFKYLSELLSHPENKYNPVYNLEMAEYYLNARKYKESSDQVGLVDRYKQRFPPELYAQRVARLYEVEAKAMEGQFNATEEPKYLDKAISAWKRYVTHVKANNDATKIKFGEDYIAKLEKIRARVQ